MCDEIKLKNAIMVNFFNENSVKIFKKEFDELNSSPLPIIPVFIDSYGGEIYSLFAMMDIISTALKPVATIALGKAMSCGSVLLACGTPNFRFVGPFSTVMIHEAATISFGKIEELKADVFEADRLNTMLINILNERCNKPKNYFQKIISDGKHTNIYFEPEETLTHGIADHVGVPVIDSMFNMDIVGSIAKKEVSKRKKTTSKAKKVPSKKTKK